MATDIVPAKDSACPRHIEDTTAEPPHAPLRSEAPATYVGQGCGAGKGRQVGMKSNGGYRCRGQGGGGYRCRGQGGCGSLGHSATNHPRYVLRGAESLGTITCKHRQSSDPKHSQAKKGERRNTEKQRRERMAARRGSQATRVQVLSFTDGKRARFLTKR